MRQHDIGHNAIGYMQPQLAGAKASRPAVRKQVEDAHAVLAYPQHNQNGFALCLISPRMLAYPMQST